MNASRSIVQLAVFTLAASLLALTPSAASAHRDTRKEAGVQAAASVGMLAYSDKTAPHRIGIFTIWTDGSHRRQLTADNGFNPVWSPDGTQIAYEASNGIRVMTATGGSRQTVAEGTEPAWAPDGRSLSYECGVGGELCTLDLATGEETVIVAAEPDWVAIGRQSWSPDGSWIVFERTSVDGDDYTLYRQLFLVRPDGTEITPVPNTFPEATLPAWSPDGEVIAYTERYDGRGGEDTGDLFTIRPDGTQRTRVTHTLGDDQGASWSPDGQWLVMDSDGQLYPGMGGIWLLTKSDSRRYFVGDGFSPSWRPGFTRPAADPLPRARAQGPRIAYVAHSQDGFDLYTVRPDGTGRRRLTDTGDVGDPSWSPDHTRIAYFRGTPGYGGAPWIVNHRTGATRRVLRAGYGDGAIGWSPNGRRLAWGTFEGLILYNLRTGGHRLLEMPRGCCTRDPSWSPSGKRLVFSQESGIGFTDLMIINSRGKGLRQVTRLRREVLHPDWAPNGRRILFTHISGPPRTADSVIRSVRPDGTRNKVVLDLTLSHNPAWSPNGRRVAFDADGDRPFSRPTGAGLRTAGPNGHGRQYLVRDRSIVFVDW